MVTAMLVLLGVAAVVALSIARPSGSFLAPAPADRDRERTLAELRGMSAYRADVRIP